LCSFWYGKNNKNNKIREGGGMFMKRFKAQQTYLLFILILSGFLITLISGCGGHGGETDKWMSPAPEVTTIGPADVVTGAGPACINETFSATFSKAMDPATIVSATPGALLTFTVKDTPTGTNVPGIVTYDDATMTATFTPTVIFSPSVNYTATITTAATATDGTPLAADVIWNFTVAATICNPPPPVPPASCAGPGPVDMGAAATFGVLAGPPLTGALTNNGLLTLVNGDVAASSITTAPALGVGFHIYTGTDAQYEAAAGAMLTAIACALGRTCDFNYTGVTDFSAVAAIAPLQPGVHCVHGGAMNVSSPVILNLTNKGVYIFRSEGALTSADGVTVQFSGSANAANSSVFWVPDGAAHINANNHFLGTIMPTGDAAITLDANTTLLPGRVLSNSAVTLSTNTITIPAP
jgi:hypothetical protein